MKAARTGPNAFTLEFESEDELREEHRANLSQGGLRLPVSDRPALFSPAEVTLRGPSGREARVKGTVVAPLPDGVALSFEGNADALLAALLAAPAGRESPGRDVSDWDRLRGMSRTEKLLYAKSAYLTYQTAELILKTAQWAANVEVRTALVHNPKTPPTFALRILPTLPEAEVRANARGAATSMALKQAALRRLQAGV